MADLRHLTWSGRAAAVWYPIRRLFIAPAATADRCIMGAPIGPHVWCPRRAIPGELWCTRHIPDKAAVRSGTGGAEQ